MTPRSGPRLADVILTILSPLIYGVLLVFATIGAVVVRLVEKVTAVR